MYNFGKIIGYFLFFSVLVTYGFSFERIKQAEKEQNGNNGIKTEIRGHFIDNIFYISRVRN